MGNVLSIDWDFFFNNIEEFDWGHNEENAIFYEWVWQTRAFNRGMLTGKIAGDYIRPNIPDNFWQQIVQNVPKHLCICDSHSEMDRFLSYIGGKHRVVNFDMHHDFGYRTSNAKLDCGNWALMGMMKGRISEYNLIYPEWRKGSPETEEHLTLDRFLEKEVKIFYGPSAYKEFPEQFDAIFICRSSCWCPSWADKDFINFVQYWKKYKTLWRNKLCAEWTIRERKFDFELAKKMDLEAQKVLEQFRRQNEEKCIV